MMQDNIWGNRDREKGENNSTNPRNHHLESGCKPYASPPKGCLASPPNKDKRDIL